MKEDAMNNEQTKPGYNVQTAAKNRYIVNMQMYRNPTDTTTLPDFLRHGKELTGVMPLVATAARKATDSCYRMVLRPM